LPTEAKSKGEELVQKIEEAITTIVGIFDDAWNVEKATEELAAAGFEDTVFDEAIVAEQPGSAGAIPFRAPGSAPERTLGENAPNLISKRIAAPLSRRLRRRWGAIACLTTSSTGTRERLFTMENLSS
jgi:hypothetical protein